MNIGDIYFGLRGDDGSQLVVDAQKAAQAAGVKGGASFSAAFGKASKKIAMAGLGAAVGGAFGLAASKGAELDSVMRKFEADTGATDAEAHQAAGAIASMYSRNLEGMGQIGDTLAKVYEGLHLSGDAADAAAEHFLKFETATNQDSDAVEAIRKDLDAWNLDASNATNVMDALVASHQQWGGSISGDQEMLAKLAPTLKAANLSWQDGLAIINMFTAAGIDASKVPTALAKALKTVKSPEELRKLLSDISAIKDPFERAQKAAAIFGTKAGPQLADALSRGGLDKFAVDMDKAQGASDRAADAVESSWGNRFTLLMHEAGANLATFGQQFGPILMVATSLGPKLTSALSSGLGSLGGILTKKLVAAITGSTAATTEAAAATGALTGEAEASADLAAKQAAIPADVAAETAAKLPVETSAATGVGTAVGAAEASAEATAIAAAAPEEAAAVAAQGPAMAAAGAGIGRLAGSSMGRMFASAFAAIAVTAVVTTYENESAKLEAHALALQQQVSSWAKGASDADLQTQLDFLKKEKEQVGKAFWEGGAAAQLPPWMDPLGMSNWDVLGGKDKVQKSIDAVEAEMETRKSDVRGASDDAFGGMPDAADAAGAATDNSVKLTLLDVVGQVRSWKNEFVSAWSGALDETARAQEIGLEKQLLQQKIADDEATMHNRKKWKKLSAEEKLELEQRLLQNRLALQKLLVEETTYGTREEQIAKTKALLTSQAMLDGLASKDPDIRKLWEGLKQKAETQLAALEKDAPGYAEDTVTAYADAMDSNADIISAAWDRILRAYFSSDAYQSFLRGEHDSYGPGSSGPNGGGSQGGNANAHGDRSNVPGYAQGLERVPYDNFVARLHRNEAVLAAPQAAAWRAGQAARSVVVQVQGLVRAETPEDIALVLRRSEAFA